MGLKCEECGNDLGHTECTHKFWLCNKCYAKWKKNHKGEIKMGEYKIEIFQYQSDNDCIPLCACGCDRPLLKGDEVLVTKGGNNFLFHNNKRKTIGKIRKMMDKLNLTEEWQKLDDEILVCKRKGCRLIKLALEV